MHHDIARLLILLAVVRVLAVAAYPAPAPSSASLPRSPRREADTQLKHYVTRLKAALPRPNRDGESRANPPAPRCTKYQFECHSGECLAIYNACDGIPQCQDGSDEAAELDCPDASKSESSEATVRPPAESTSNKDSVRRLQPAPPPRVPQEPPRQTSDESESGWDRPRYNQGYSEPLPPGDIFNHRQQGLLTGLSHFPASSGSSRQHHGIQPQPPPPPPVSFPQYEKPASVYQPPSVFYDDIYQNWAGRLPPSSYPFDSLPRYDPMALQPQRSPFPDQPLPLPPGGPQSKLAQMPPPAGWADQQPGREMNNPSAVRPAAGPSPSLEDRPLVVDRRPTPQQTPEKHKQGGPAPAAPSNATGQQQTEPPAEATTAEGTPPPTVSAPPPSPAVEEVEFSLSELRSQAALQSSESQGAAIVLTLGVLLSAILLVLALCRTQCARRRGRRGDRPGLAHDADYLVNGMYL